MQELDYCWCIGMKCSDTDSEKIEDLHFLVGLNVEYDPIRVQVLWNNEIPLLNETIAIVCGEDRRRWVMTDPKSIDGFTLLWKAANLRAMKLDQQQSNAYSSDAWGNNRMSKGWRAVDKDSLWCKPPSTSNVSWKAKNNQWGEQRQAHLTSTQSRKEREVSQELSN